MFASVSSAEPDDPEAVSTEGGQNIPSRQHMAKSAVNLRLLARAVAARASTPTFHYHLGKGNKGGRSLAYPLKTKRLFSNPEIVPALRTIQIIAATTTARCPASRRVARAKRHRPRVRMQAAMLVETTRAPPCSTTVYRRRVSERASRQPLASEISAVSTHPSTPKRTQSRPLATLAGSPYSICTSPMVTLIMRRKC